jgi:hypothetical protein
MSASKVAMPAPGRSIGKGGHETKAGKKESMKRIFGWFDESSAAERGVVELTGAGFASGDVEMRVEPGNGASVAVRCEGARAAGAMRCLAAAGARRVAMETLAAGEPDGRA